MRQIFALISLFAITMAAPGAGAREGETPELITDRPDQTESSATVPKGYVQLEVGVTIDGSFGETEALSFPNTLLRVGVHENLELRFGFDGWTKELSDGEESGAGDGELGLKWRFMTEKGARPEGAILAGVSLPIGADEFSTDRFDPNFRLSFGHTLTERLSLGYNAGVEWETETNTRETLLGRLLPFVGRGAQIGQTVGTLTRAGSPLADSVAPAVDLLSQFTGHEKKSTLSTAIYTLALGIEITPRVGAFVEFYGGVPLSASGGPDHSFDGGFTFLVRDYIQLDVAGGFGLNGEADDWFFTTGASFLF